MLIIILIVRQLYNVNMHERNINLKFKFTWCSPAMWSLEKHAIVVDIVFSVSHRNRDEVISIHCERSTTHNIA